MHFDDLSKALASTISRREAIRLLLSSLAAACLAAVGLNKAAADNSDCAHFCDAIYPPGPERGQCKSQAAHGYGICYQCGPAAPAGHGQVCGSGANRFCCRADQVCAGGACVCPQGTEECGGQCVPLCGPGQRRNPQTCQCEALPNACREGGACFDAAYCGANSECVCFTTVEGTPFCHLGQSCSGSQTCTSSAECPAGYACSTVTCCGSQGICIQPCGGMGLAPLQHALGRETLTGVSGTTTGR